MRVNVYGDELTDDIQLVQRVVNGRIRFGLRVYLESAQVLGGEIEGGSIEEAIEEAIENPTEDNRSAVTFWIPEIEDPERGMIPNFNLMHRMINGLDEHRYVAWMLYQGKLMAEAQENVREAQGDVDKAEEGAKGDGD